MGNRTKFNAKSPKSQPPSNNFLVRSLYNFIIIVSAINFVRIDKHKFAEYSIKIKSWRYNYVGQYSNKIV